jgi:uncharacterized protein YbjT (DUF2867 family)
MMAGATDPMILVTGATGRVGGCVVEELLASGQTVRGLSRDPNPSAVTDDIELVEGDLSDPDSLGPALDGVGAVFLLWHQPSAHEPRRAVEAIARRVQRIVYLSSLGVQDDLEEQTHPMSAIHAELERSIADSTERWTVLRSSWFASNAIGWADEIRRTGAVRRPYPEARRSPIAEEDLGAVAARVLSGSGHEGRTYVLTGPQQLTERELIATVGEVIGRPAVCEPIAPELARSEMLDAGLSPELVDAALEYWRRFVDRPEPVTSTVEDTTGRPAMPFSRWVRSHAEEFEGTP